jgi:hypothetical protein
MDDLLGKFLGVVDNFQAQGHDLLDFENTAFDRDYVAFNVRVSDLETHLQVRLRCRLDRVCQRVTASCPCRAGVYQQLIQADHVHHGVIRAAGALPAAAAGAPGCECGVPSKCMTWLVLLAHLSSARFPQSGLGVEAHRHISFVRPGAAQRARGVSGHEAEASEGPKHAPCSWRHHLGPAPARPHPGTHATLSEQQEGS